MRHHYNAEPLTLPNGEIDFGAHVPFGASLRPRLPVISKQTGYRVECFRKLYAPDAEPMGYEGESREDALAMFEKAVQSGDYRYVSLTDLSANTIINDHSDKTP